MAENAQDNLVILIDADNAQASVIEEQLAEMARYGVAIAKPVYGDWSRTNLKPWKEAALKYALQAVQQFAYTKGKNATDTAMIIDAMDLLYSKRFGGFCLVSSDSDFTKLASRIREEGLVVYGFGERKTPRSFVSACDKFIYTDILIQKWPLQSMLERASPRTSSRMTRNWSSGFVQRSNRPPMKMAGLIWRRWAIELPNKPRTSIPATTAMSS